MTGHERSTHPFFLLTEMGEITTLPAGEAFVYLHFAPFSVQAAMLKRFRFLFLAGVFLSVLFLSTGGCNVLFPGKKDKDPLLDNAFNFETEDGKPKLVGDCASVSTLQTIPVRGFGLVVNLPGTGGEDANTFHYQWVYDDLNRKKHVGIRALLARPDTAVVEIIGHMHAGIQKGDRFDVQILLPPNTNTSSLRGGVLVETKLFEIGGSTQDPLTSKPRAHVAGPIMVDDPTATGTSNPSGLKKGTILNGAVTVESRSLSLIMKDKSIAGADQIARAINHRFYLTTGTRKGVAAAETDRLIVLDIHPSYVHDVSRYVRVIQSIACRESAGQQLRRVERLKEELFVRDTAQQAAFQLEAVGKPGIETLQQALRSPDMEIRFHAATSLAYLGDSTSAKVLADIAQQEPAFRVYALNALSVMKNDLEAEYYLQELLHVPSAETRYGAFRALKTRNPLDQTIRGEMPGGQFSYHGITSQAVPMVHITTQRSPEVVLFGTDIFVKQPFYLSAGATIVVNGQVPGSVVVTRFVTEGVDERRTVSNRLDEIIRAVADMGGTYPDIVQMLRQADMMHALSCRLEVNCLPEPNRIYRRQSDDSDMAEVEVEKSKSFWDHANPKNLFSATRP